MRRLASMAATAALLFGAGLGIAQAASALDVNHGINDPEVIAGNANDDESVLFPPMHPVTAPPVHVMHTHQMVRHHVAHWSAQS